MSDPSSEHEMPSEIDFSNAVRGKHTAAYRQPHRVRVIHQDGTIEERHYAPEADAVVIDPDLRGRFPDSESVNRALRSLVESD